MEAPKPENERCTYADYAKWPEGERWELIEGRAYAMTPAPLINHQVILGALHLELGPFFRGKPCKALLAPVDVLLPDGQEADDAIDTVVQPDLLVVCDPKKVESKGVRGAPDLVIEILSAGTAERDLGEKLRLYEKHGVRCYIIVDPWGKVLTVRYRKPEGGFGVAEHFEGGMKAPIRIFEGLELDLASVFAGI